MNENMREIIQESASVQSSHDFELDIERESQVEYRYAYKKDIKLKGIVFIIPGFGDDTDSEYSEYLRAYIANTFDVVAVHVIYHCFYSRETNGARVVLDKIDEEMLLENLKFAGISKLENTSLNSIFQQLSNGIALRKKRGEIPQETALNQTLTLLPKNGEYQNFGVLQALDHINVLQDITKRNLDFIEQYPTILMGSSHGGYIAYLIAKFAPNLIDCVIDNSAYVKPSLRYIIGKDLEVKRPECQQISQNVVAQYFVKTYWCNDADSYYYFSKDRFDIRDVSKEGHMRIVSQVSQNKIKYVAYHYAEDTIAPLKEKQEFYEELKRLGFDSSLQIISSVSQVDGKFIKSLEHGLSMSMKELAKRELPNALKLRCCSKTREPEPIAYECESLVYNFQMRGDVFNAVITPREDIREKIMTTFEDNMNYFEKYQPELYNKLASFDSAIEQGFYKNRYDIVFENNSFNIQEIDKNRCLYQQNSNKFSYEIAQKFQHQAARFIFFGVGLGLHLESIDKKIAAQSYLIVEDDLELFKFSTFVTSYATLAQSAQLYFSVFDNEEQFSSIAEEFVQKSVRGDRNLMHYSMPYHADDKKNYFNKTFGMTHE